MIYKTLHRKLKLKIEQHEAHYKPELKDDFVFRLGLIKNRRQKTNKQTNKSNKQNETKQNKNNNNNKRMQNQK